MEETFIFDAADPESDGLPDGDANPVPDPGEFDGTIHYTDIIPERYLTSYGNHRIDCRLHYTFPDPERYCTCKRNAKRDIGTQPEPKRNLRAYRDGNPDEDSWDLEPYA